MQRMENSRGMPTLGPAPMSSGPTGWLAGMVIGSAIMTMATQAMMLGFAMAINDATAKRG